MFSEDSLDTQPVDQFQAAWFDLQGPCTEPDTKEPWAAACAKWSWHQRRAVQGRSTPPSRDHRWKPKWEWPTPTATWTSSSAKTVSEEQRASAVAFILLVWLWWRRRSGAPGDKVDAGWLAGWIMGGRMFDLCLFHAEFPIKLLSSSLILNRHLFFSE